MDQNRQTRRDFLKTTMAASAALAAADLTIPRTVHAAGSDVIRYGMIGCGGRCSGAAMDAMKADPSVRLVAMCDLFADRIQGKYDSLKSQMPKQVMVDKDHMFVGLDGYKKVIDSVDVVLIACAAKFHPMYAMAAIQSGKHVFVEKPHGIDPVGVRLMQSACDLAKEKKLSILSGLHRRFDPGMQETIKRIQDGAIGNIVAIEENFIRPPYGVDRRHDGQNELHFQYANQYRFSWLCGDDVPQSLVHNLDRASWAMNETPPVRCHGLAGRSTCLDRPYVYGDVFDHHSVVYQYANGIRLYALCRTAPGCYNEMSGIIMGSKGIAYTEEYHIQGQTNWQYKGEPVSAYEREHVELFKAIRSGNPLNCGHYMAKSTMIGVMGQMSCYSGQEVTWDQVNKSNFCFAPRPEDCTWDMQPPVKPDSTGTYPVAIPGKTQLA
ncbi:MAG TPA: Gfo/Idh/MocA family oxidoreductase [Tepidisphaeraceae bacterium]|nr:Gfo/Idh/MocA family oxidoreductase [Tepidisphaeraceae bacterium]